MCIIGILVRTEHSYALLSYDATATATPEEEDEDSVCSRSSTSRIRQLKDPGSFEVQELGFFYGVHFV